MNEPLIIGARGSALARIQAMQVGAALQTQDPKLQVKYLFSASPADLPYGGDATSPTQDVFESNVGRIIGGGGFTSHLQGQLDDRTIDLAVHSWKDLPLVERATTLVAATLPRADIRDVILFRASVPDELRRGQFEYQPLRVLSCSARRRVNLGPFLRWALPGPVQSVTFVPVRGDIERRLTTLVAGNAHALVIAKAALDRLLQAPRPTFAATSLHIRSLLDQCQIMIVPIAASPAAPGQGALAIEARRDRHAIAARLVDINDARDFKLVQTERLRLARLGDDETPVGISTIALAFGDVEFVRGESNGVPIERTTLTRIGKPLPRPAHADQVWSGERDGADPFTRIAMPLPVGTLAVGTGLLVARADALPLEHGVADDQLVWTAGLTTWRKLATRGVWVTGSDESLGETAALSVRHMFPHIGRWIKLSHWDGFDSPHAQRLATYSLRRARIPAPVHNFTHFFWRSGSQFREYLRHYPGLENAWHGCGPGNTLAQLRTMLAPPLLQPFLSGAQFRAELAA